jgi:hypothetical protein
MSLFCRLFGHTWRRQLFPGVNVESIREMFPALKVGSIWRTCVYCGFSERIIESDFTSKHSDTPDTASGRLP